MAEQTNLEKQVEQLTEQVNTLTLRVFVLEQNASLPTTATDPQQQKTTPPAKKLDRDDFQIAGKNLLPRIASVCFLLVIALGLRTMTDSGVLNLQIGSLLGIIYAAALIMTSWILYKNESVLAPVFNFCGAALLFSVTLETHTRFEAFPQEVAYILFALTGITLGTISHIYQVASPILVGTLGMCLSGVALGFPSPYFPYLMLLLWLANILGFFASRIKHCSWLRWTILGVTLTMLQTWGLRIGLAPTRGEQLASFAPGWLLPMAALISITYLSISLLGIIGSGDRRISKFDFSLPTVTACYGFLFGMYILKGSTVFTLTVAVAALGHLAIAYLLSRRELINAPGTNAFTLAGAVLLSFSLPVLFHSLLLSLPILSILALLIAFLSSKWGSGGMRVTSYLAQAYTGIAMLILLANHNVDSGSTLAIACAAICTATGLAHFRFCRRNVPPTKSLVFERFDPQDYSAATTLLSGLSSGFAVTMFIVLTTLYNLLGQHSLQAYLPIQTITINSAAVVLMALALAWRNKEFRNIAILLMLIGGAKAFMIDLLSIKGLGLVISIFSFGVSVSFVSFALTRWQKFDESINLDHEKNDSTNFAPQG